MADSSAPTSPTTPTPQSNSKLFLSGILSPPSLENRMMNRHAVPYAQATRIASQALSSCRQPSIRELRDECEQVLLQQNNNNSSSSPSKAAPLLLSPASSTNNKDNDNESNERTSMGRRDEDDDSSQATLAGTLSPADVCTSSGSMAEGDEEEELEEDNEVEGSESVRKEDNNMNTNSMQESLLSTDSELAASLSGSDQQKLMENSNVAITAKDMASHHALSPALGHDDPPSVVNTASTTVTAHSGTSVPSVIYLLRRNLVPLDEPLELPFGVVEQQRQKKKKATLFKRLRGSLRRSSPTSKAIEMERLTELDDEVFERTLVQI